MNGLDDKLEQRWNKFEISFSNQRKWDHFVSGETMEKIFPELSKDIHLVNKHPIDISIGTISQCSKWWRVVNNIQTKNFVVDINIIGTHRKELYQDLSVYKDSDSFLSKTIL